MSQALSVPSQDFTGDGAQRKLEQSAVQVPTENKLERKTTLAFICLLKYSGTFLMHSTRGDRNRFRMNYLSII